MMTTMKGNLRIIRPNSNDSDSRETVRTILERYLAKADQYDSVVVVLQEKGEDGRVVWDAMNCSRLETILCLLQTTLFKFQCMMNGVVR